MAKADNNLILRNVSGMIGGQIVVRRGRNGTYVLAAAPRRCTRQSEAQRAQRERFRRAAQFAKTAQRWPRYVELAKARNQTAYVVAISEFLSNPEVQHSRDTGLEPVDQSHDTVAATSTLLHQEVHTPASNPLRVCVAEGLPPSDVHRTSSTLDDLFLAGVGIGVGKCIESMDGIPYLAFLATAVPITSSMFTAAYECTFGTFIRLELEKTCDGM